jgi:hypothetical protein
MKFGTKLIAGLTTKNHWHDIANFFSDPQDKVLGEMARRWPPLERKITPSLYNLVIFCFALFAFSAFPSLRPMRRNPARILSRPLSWFMGHSPDPPVGMES